MNPNLQQVSSVYFFVMLITLGLAILLIRYTVTLLEYLKKLVIKNFIQDLIHM